MYKLMPGFKKVNQYINLFMSKCVGRLFLYPGPRLICKKLNNKWVKLNLTIK